MEQKKHDTYDIDSLNEGVALADEHVIKPEVMNEMPEHKAEIRKDGKAIDPDKELDR